MVETPDSKDFNIEDIEAAGFDINFPNDDIETDKIRLLKDIWHNQATQIKWLTKIHEELKKANSK